MINGCLLMNQKKTIGILLPHSALCNIGLLIKETIKELSKATTSTN